eukprot:364938-Chlamydomonas_euryale.AAC.3
MRVNLRAQGDGWEGGADERFGHRVPAPVVACPDVHATTVSPGTSMHVLTQTYCVDRRPWRDSALAFAMGTPGVTATDDW